MIDAAQKLYLKDLAKRVKELSKTQHNQNLIRKYKDINSLKKVDSPAIFVALPGQAVSEYMSDEKPRIEDGLFAAIEYQFLWSLCRAKKLGDDMPVTAVYHTGWHYYVTPWMDGYKPVHIDSNLKMTDFKPCIAEYADIKKMRKPKLTVDHRKTDEVYEQIRDAIGDVLTVVKGHPYHASCGWGDSMFDQFYEMRGPEQVLYDLVDAPEFIHEAMSFMTEAKIELMEQFKKEGILCLNNGANLLGSSSLGFCDELPGDDYQPDRVIEKNLWGFAHTQEFADVSPEMWEEFVLPYQAQLINRFGLSLYGCCEPVEYVIPSLEKYIKNLRMMSISPSTSHEIAAPLCEGKYVYAWKPPPTPVVFFDEQSIKKEAERVFSLTRNCCVAVTLRDVMSYEGNAGRFNRWLKIMREAAAEKYL